MSPPEVKHDPLSDTLIICLEPGPGAVCFRLNSHILLRWDMAGGYPRGLHLMDYSRLTKPTEMGLRSVPLTGLSRMPSELRESVIAALQRPPLDEFITLSTYVPPRGKEVPIASIHVRTVAA